MGHVRQKAAFYDARGVAAEVLSRRRSRRPSPTCGRAWRAPSGCRATASSTRRRRVAAARARPPPGRRVGRGARRGDRAGPRVDGGRGRSRRGRQRGRAAAPRLSRPADRPAKGHLVITDRYPGFCRHQLVELGYLKSAHTLARESVAFNVQPRPTGQLLVGSSRELVGWDASIKRPVRGRMLAARRVPARRSRASRAPHLGGLPAGDAGQPAADRPVGARPGIAAGHEGLGVTTALGTARADRRPVSAGRRPRPRALRPAAARCPRA